MPTVGIILSTYDRPEWLRRAIASVFAQDYRDWILYLCDDCGTPETEDVCRATEALDPARVRYIRQKKNWGDVTRGRNDAILREECDYYTFMDDDNILLGKRISSQLKFMEEHPDCGVSWGHCLSYINGKRGKVMRPGFRQYDRARLLRQGNYIDSNEIMVRKQVFGEVGLFDERLNCLEDWDLMLRVGKRFKVLHFDRILLLYGLHENNRVELMTGKTASASALLKKRDREEGEQYRVLLVPPPNGNGAIADSHRAVVGHINSALQSRPWLECRCVFDYENVRQAADEFGPNLIIYIYPARQPKEVILSKDYLTLGLGIEDPYAYELNKQCRKHFQWFVTNERTCLPAYNSAENPYSLMMPSLSAPAQHLAAICRLEIGNDVVLVGHPYPERVAAVKALRPLAAKGYKIGVVGERWDLFPEATPNMQVKGKHIDTWEFAALCRDAKVTVIANRQSNGVKPTTPARGFAEAYAGACMLMQTDREGIHEYFTEGEDFIGWKKPEELPGLVEMLLADDAKRESLKQNARRKAENYTYEKRLTRLLMMVRGWHGGDEVK